MMLASLALMAALSQAAPPRDARQPATASRPASLSGQVVDDRGDPVPAVMVVAVGGPAVPGARSTLTLENGRFVIGDLAPGVYTLSLSRAGYPPINYGQSRVDGPGRPFAIEAGGAIALSLTLPRGAVIAGTIVDDNGEPTSLPVAIVRESGAASADKSAWPGVRVDPHGSFRTAGLAAGTYRVGAWPPSREPSPNDPVITLTVAAGQEHTGLIVRARPPQSTTYLTVTLGTSDGQPVAKFPQVRLHRDDGARQASFSSRPNPDGTQTITAVPAGRYRVIAHAGAYWGSGDVLVDGEHPATVSVTMNRGVAIRGRATLDGAPPGAIRVSLMTAAAETGSVMEDNNGAFGRVEADGSFTIANVPPGRYLLRALTDEQEGVALAAATLGDIDAADVPLTVADRDVAGVAVTLTRSRTMLKGTVTDATGGPANSVDVIAFPVDPRFRVRNSRRVTFARTTITGEYAIAGLPPGDYALAVVDEMDREALKDPAVIAQLTPLATVKLTAGDTRVDVRRPQ